ncbi:helix-turn-helix domain-containing protein [Bacillus sp. FJAT-26390]|uniref:helix-turn-helix domain-containing protein n=1 Tax=Bacillus sp. FJAT-26390 TaxID=1743142 RepID=UPI000807A2C2|nr:helix-turn-helix domain-containing protein [Bacillus sp. FJAT-26390]OBZ09360.1 hypothetical protein A7975_24980 [Bacillus sp. FJAT-26390]
MEYAASDERILFICKLMSGNFQAQARYVNTQLEPLTGTDGNGQLASPLYASLQALLEQLHLEAAMPQYPLIQTLNELENYVIVRIQRESQHAGYVVFGPSAYADIPAEAITGMLNDYAVPIDQKEAARAYYKALPIISGLKLLHASVLLYYLLYGKELATLDIFHHRSLLSQAEQERFGRHVDRNLSDQRETTALHHDFELEKQLFQYMKEGRTEMLQRLATIDPQNLGILSRKSYLRSQKNITIAGITLATRAAMEGGLHSEIAYTMSDLYIQHLEELTDIQSVVKLRTEAMLGFAERVRHSRAGQFSKVVMECQQYIFNHIYENISVAALAGKVRLNANYLSQLFKKEVGIPIHSYIMREKVEEAKRLLTASELTLSEIWARLNFYDQSHFTKIFKKQIGVTPKQYRAYGQVRLEEKE